MNPDKIREDFPILNSKLDGKPVVYFDNACMTLKPRQVVEATNNYYYDFPGCAGRSMHKVGKMVTDQIDKSRSVIQKFIGAKRSSEIVFTRNTTEGLNLVAKSMNWNPGDKIIISDKEHNSNLLPFQRLSSIGVKTAVVPSDEIAEFDLEKFKEMIDETVRLVSLGHTRNLDGSSVPAREIIRIAHDHGAHVMLDAAQSAPHKEINVKNLNVDFLAFSGHKMLGPTGTGVLYGKQELLEKLNPYNVGGETVVDATYDTAEFEKPPHKFEAGLQHYAGIVGLAEACNYLSKIGMSEIQKHEIRLNQIITEGLEKIDGLNIIGPDNPEKRSGIVSFYIEGVDPHQIALLLDNSNNIMIRSGAHCNHAWFNSHKLQGSARASCYIYNTEFEAQQFVEEATKVIDLIK